MRNSIIFTTLLLVVSAPVLSQSKAVGVHGWGNALCAEYTNEIQDGKKLASYQHWLTGYITGFNRFGPEPSSTERNVAEQYNLPALTGWMARFCAENPLWLVEEAAFALVSDLSKQPKNK